MKILILSDANSVHTLKWVNGLKKHNFKLMLFSLFKPNKVYKKFYWLKKFVRVFSNSETGRLFMLTDMRKIAILLFPHSIKIYFWYQETH